MWNPLAKLFIWNSRGDARRSRSGGGRGRVRGGGGGRRMAGILYANIQRRLTITLARGKRLTQKKKIVTQTKQKSQVRVRLLVSEIFYGFVEWNQQL